MWCGNRGTTRSVHSCCTPGKMKTREVKIINQGLEEEMVCVAPHFYNCLSYAALVNHKSGLGVSTRASACAGGVGLPALPVEDGPGGCRCRLLGGSPAAAALLAARVGREGHLHAHLAERGAHAPAQNHGRRTFKRRR